MRMPRVRFTVRRMMVAVAVLAVVLGAGEATRKRRSRFGREAGFHGAFMRLYARSPPVHFPNKERLASHRRSLAEKKAYHESLAGKYEQAARHPWLPVAPDPPEPE